MIGKNNIVTTMNIKHKTRQLMTTQLYFQMKPYSCLKEHSPELASTYGAVHKSCHTIFDFPLVTKI